MAKEAIYEKFLRSGNKWGTAAATSTRASFFVILSNFWQTCNKQQSVGWHPSKEANLHEFHRAKKSIKSDISVKNASLGAFNLVENDP